MGGLADGLERTLYPFIQGHRSGLPIQLCRRRLVEGGGGRRKEHNRKSKICITYQPRDLLR